MYMLAPFVQYIRDQGQASFQRLVWERDYPEAKSDESNQYKTHHPPDL